MAVIRAWVIGTSSESPPAIASVCTWGGPSGASSAESDGAMPGVADSPRPAAKQRHQHDHGDQRHRQPGDQPEPSRVTPAAGGAPPTALALAGCDHAARVADRRRQGRRLRAICTQSSHWGGLPAGPRPPAATRVGTMARNGARQPAEGRDPALGAAGGAAADPGRSLAAGVGGQPRRLHLRGGCADSDPAESDRASVRGVSGCRGR